MLSRRLRTMREKKGLTQHELGQICQLGPNQLSRYENGLADPSIHTLRKIADYLEVSADFLLGLTDDPHVQVREPGLNVDERLMLETFRLEGWQGIARLGVERMSK